MQANLINEEFEEMYEALFWFYTIIQATVYDSDAIRFCYLI